jgi:hypothetical protein
VAYEFIKILNISVCKTTTRQPSPTRLILEDTQLMYGGAYESDLQGRSALRKSYAKVLTQRGCSSTGSIAMKITIIKIE